MKPVTRIRVTSERIDVMREWPDSRSIFGTPMTIEIWLVRHPSRSGTDWIEGTDVHNLLNALRALDLMQVEES